MLERLPYPHPPCFESKLAMIYGHLKDLVSTACTSRRHSWPCSPEGMNRLMRLLMCWRAKFQDVVELEAGTEDINSYLSSALTHAFGVCLVPLSVKLDKTFISTVEERCIYSCSFDVFTSFSWHFVGFWCLTSLGWTEYINGNLCTTNVDLYPNLLANVISVDHMLCELASISLTIIRISVENACKFQLIYMSGILAASRH